MMDLVWGRLYAQMIRNSVCVCVVCICEIVKNVNNRPNETTVVIFVFIILMRCKSGMNAVLMVKNEITLVLSVLISTSQ